MLGIVSQDELIHEAFLDLSVDLVTKGVHNLRGKVNVLVAMADEIVADKLSASAAMLLKGTRRLREELVEIKESGEYPDCLRAVFGAVWYNRLTNMGGPISLNRPSDLLSEVCQKGLGCPRSLLSYSLGNNYDTCPAVHALEGLPTPPSPWGLIWVEGGYLFRDDDIVPWHLDGLYPCLRCLCKAAAVGIGYLAALRMEDEHMPVSFHHVESHAAALLLLQTETAILAKAEGETQ